MLRLERHLGKGLWAVAVQAMPLFYGVAAVFLLVRVLPPSEYGAFVLAQGAVQVTVMVNAAVVYRHMVRKLSSDEWDRELPFNSLLLSLISFAIFLVPIVIFRREIASVLNSPQLVHLFMSVVPLQIGGFFLKDFFQKVLAAGRRPAKLLLSNGTFFVLMISGLLYLNLTGSLFLAEQVIFLSASAAFASAAVGLSLTSSVWRRMSLRFSWNQQRKIFGYGKFVGGAAGANFIATMADSYLISTMWGPVQVAFYNSAKVFYKIYQSIPQLMELLVFPFGSKLAQENRTEDLKALYEKVVCFLYLLLVPVNLIVLTVAEALYKFAYTGKYEGAHTILQLLVIGSTAIPLITVGASILYAMEKPRSVFLSKLTTILFVITAGVILTFNYGPIGMAAAFATGMFIQAAHVTYFVRRMLPVTLGGVLSRTRDAFQFALRTLRTDGEEGTGD